MEKLREASAAEAEAANAVWQAAQASANSAEETSVSDDNSLAAEATSDGSDAEADVRLHPRAVCPLQLPYSLYINCLVANSYCFTVTGCGS